MALFSSNRLEEFMVQYTKVAAPKRRAPVAFVATITVAAFAIACADNPASPLSTRVASSGPSRTVVANQLTSARGLLRITPLAERVVVVKTLSRSGGDISIPGTDFELQVPSGAFAEKSMTFKITAYAGRVVAYDFQPHGVKFLKPLKAVQKLGQTNYKSLQLPTGYRASWAGAYFADSTQLNLTSGEARIDEFMACGWSNGGTTLTWEIPHFSGYMISTGRQDDE